jgi:hypothetical protein
MVPGGRIPVVHLVRMGGTDTIYLDRDSEKPICSPAATVPLIT